LVTGAGTWEQGSKAGRPQFTPGVRTPKARRNGDWPTEKNLWFVKRFGQPRGTSTKGRGWKFKKELSSKRVVSFYGVTVGYWVSDEETQWGCGDAQPLENV